MILTVQIFKIEKELLSSDLMQFRIILHYLVLKRMYKSLVNVVAEINFLSGTKMLFVVLIDSASYSTSQGLGIAPFS